MRLRLQQKGFVSNAKAYYWGTLLDPNPNTGSSLHVRVVRATFVCSTKQVVGYWLIGWNFQSTANHESAENRKQKTKRKTTCCLL